MDDFKRSLFGRPGTIRTYTNLYDNHIAPFIDDEKLLTLSDIRLNCLIQQWLHEGLSARTIKQLVRLTVRYAKFLGGTPPDPAPILRKLARQKQETIIRSFTRNEAQKFLDYLSKKECNKLYLLALFGIHAGLRRGEIFGLQYGDIDALKNRITVSRSYKGPTKNGRNRQVPLSERLALALESNEYLTKPPQEQIFTYFDPNFDLKRICQTLAIKHITVHDLRHTFATLALESGVSPRTVQSWLGHSSLSTTLNIYWSALPSEVRMDFAP